MSVTLLCKSRELRGGILYTNCGCPRRNGLQYDCQRTECQGRVICLKKPFPKCCPSTFGNRFANISMGKCTNPVGARMIRVFNNGSKCHSFIFYLFSIYFLNNPFPFLPGCVIQYDPCVGLQPVNASNPCGPQLECKLPKYYYN